MAVKLGLARQLVGADPATAEAMLEELRDRRADDAHRAARAGPRHLPAAAARSRPGRGAADGGQPGGAPGRRPGRGRRPLLQRDRGRRLLLLPRGHAERGQVRRAGRVASWSRSPPTPITSRSTSTDDGPGFEPGAGDRRSRLRQHARPPRRPRWRAHRRSPNPGAHESPDGCRSRMPRPPDGVSTEGGHRPARRSSSGPGPNGLVAAVTLAQAGWKVTVLEAAAAPGGGTRSAELTLPGYVHDVCSAIHPLGLGSPALRDLPLEDHGLRWIQPDAPLAHPLEGDRVALLERSVDATAAGLGPGRRSGLPPADGAPRARRGRLVDWLLAPLSFPPSAAAGAGPLRAQRHPLGPGAGPVSRFEGDQARGPVRRAGGPLDAARSTRRSPRATA